MGGVCIRFTVPGPPAAKAKKVGTRAGHGFSFNDPQTTLYQNLVTMAARDVCPDAPLDGPLVLRIVAVYPRLAAHNKRSKRTGELLGGVTEGRIPKASFPDWDNLGKSIGDGITHSGMWTDDGRVFDGRVVKWYAAVGELPHVEVEVREYAGE